MASVGAEAWKVRRWVRSGFEHERHSGVDFWLCEWRGRDCVVKWRCSGLRSWYLWLLAERLAARMRRGCAAAARGSSAGDTKLIAETCLFILSIQMNGNKECGL
jgi:hypothetical protein